MARIVTRSTRADLFHNHTARHHQAVVTTSAMSSLSLDACCDVFRVPEMRAMFPCVEALIRLLLVYPASSASAERSFSSWRRLKTDLRSTCGQRRLNNLAICHVHKDIVDEVDVNELMQEFILRRDGALLYLDISTSNDEWHFCRSTKR